MRHTGVRSAAVMIVAALVPCAGLAACGGSGTSEDPTTARSTSVAGGYGAAAGSGPAATSQATERDFNRRNFTHSTRIDNRFTPLVPGTQYVFEGRSNRGHGRRPHEVITTVTDLTKVIDGVRAVVIWERDINAGRLLEGELAFQAQDDDGNVWNLGEYPEEYENGRVDGAPDTWIAGVAGAHGGIMMRAAPRVGTSSYRQGFAPTIGFADRAKVLRSGLRDCVPVRCFSDVLMTDETNPNEPADGHQRKSYAPGIGTIRAAPAGGHEREQLVLTRVVRLDPQTLAAVRKRALAVDRRAYAVSKRVYGRTPRAEASDAGP